MATNATVRRTSATRSDTPTKYKSSSSSNKNNDNIRCSNSRIIRQHHVLLNSYITTKMYFILIVCCGCCCTVLLPTTYAKGYLDADGIVNALDGGRGGDGDVGGGGAGIKDGNSDANRGTIETSAEILQLPHAIRHQEHYSHRVEQAVNDFERVQLQEQQQQQQQSKERDKVNLIASSSNHNNNKTIRYQQIKAAQQLQQQQQQQEQQQLQQKHHHRRHEQHRQHQLQLQQQPLQQQQQQQQQHHQQHKDELHHLRHHNHHNYAAAAMWEQQQQQQQLHMQPTFMPPLRHQRHHQHQHQQQHQNAATAKPPSNDNENRNNHHFAAAIDVDDDDNDFDEAEFNAMLPLNDTKMQQQQQQLHRYFDRDSLFSKPKVWTTRGPKLRHHSDKNLKKTHKLHERVFGDDGRFVVDDDDAGGKAVGKAIGIAFVADDVSGQRISLKLGGDGEDYYENENGKLNNKMPLRNMDNDNDDYDEPDNDSDSDEDSDDYSYEDDPETDTAAVASNVNNEFPSSYSNGNKAAAVKRYTNPFKDYKTKAKRLDARAQYQLTDTGNIDSTATQFSSNEKIDNNDNGVGDDVADGAGNNDDDDEFSSEKWNKIEHAHHLKQQQHQRELQALRARHGSNSIYSASASTSASAAAAAAVTSSATKQRLNNNDDENENIFSRHYIPGTLTRQKQNELGTADSVQESHRAHIIKRKEHKALANKHVKQILSEASCRIPQSRVERIQRDVSKIYMPHCTILHRCADDTGCCQSARQTCAPKHTKSVDLYFFVKSMNDKRGAIERLTFINHTECHCVDRSNQAAAEYATLSNWADTPPLGQALRRATIVNCNCPKLYEKILQEDGYCRCDCSSGNTGCDWLKRGMEHFSMIDRKCIAEGRCKPPTCEYGNYLKKHGRCPRREEQLAATLGSSSSSAAATNSLSSRLYH